MKIGIIVYSYTNNTLTIANQLKTALLDKGYDVSVESIKAMNEDPNNTHIVLTHSPKLKEYDKVIFASCVRGFNCAPILKEYINQLDTLKDIKCAGFVSQYFPWDALGGNQALNVMRTLVESKRGLFYPLRSIHVKSRQKNNQVNDLIQKSIQWIES